MPFRHVTMYRWASHVDPGHVDRVRAALDELAAVARGVRYQVHGADVGVSAATYDYLVVVDFDRVDDWRAYRDHPLHLLLLAELIDGHVVDRASGQFVLPDEPTARQVGPVPASGTIGDAGVDAGIDDDELLARARRTAMAELQALLAEPDDPI